MSSTFIGIYLLDKWVRKWVYTLITHTHSRTHSSLLNSFFALVSFPVLNISRYSVWITNHGEFCSIWMLTTVLGLNVILPQYHWNGEHLFVQKALKMYLVGFNCSVLLILKVKYVSCVLSLFLLLPLPLLIQKLFITISSHNCINISYQKQWMKPRITLKWAE